MFPGAGIDYYTSQCHYSVTNSEVGGCATCGSYTRALRAFARCVENTATGVVGYCHGALQTTAHLANQYVCDEGLNRNIGYHVRIPFRVNMPGEKTALFEPFICKNEHFTKMGSGQT
jgi:hypothetical protein